ncbi:mitochondrial carrier domain-containing protein [Aspergillus undulatus]|uniref:mitochondrial carrier domain-containing protein n=1 Tax=Aspergillus undulatus TaxID=1810928 RepID=UPI003CCCF3B7
MNQQKLSPWNSVVSGTTAAVLANILVYPLDLVKTRLQVQVQKQETHISDNDAKSDSDGAHDAQYNNTLDAILRIVREEGIAGLYRGLGSSITGTASMNFAYFYWSATARSVHQSMLRSFGLSDSNSIIKEFGLNAVAGAMAQLCTNPIAVISTRQQTRKSYSEKLPLWEAIKEIVQSEDGWTGLWRGFKVNLILVVNPMITYGFYQWLQGRLKRVKNIGVLEAFSLGACSKVLATVVTHPLIVAKTMLQSEPPESRKGKTFSGFTEILAYIVSNEGLLRLYKGLAPQIIKGFLVQGLIMLLKERTELLLMMAVSIHRKRLYTSHPKRVVG